MAHQKSFYNFWTFILVLLGTTIHLCAQTSSYIELKSAQRLEGKVINNEEVRELIGNVHFTQPTKDGSEALVWCDRAIRYMVQNKMELYGNVKVVQGDATLYSDEGLYDANTRVMETHTGVRLERNGRTLTALHGIYFIDDKRSYFRTNVNLQDSTSLLTCNELFYYELQNRSVARDSVHFISYINHYHIYGDSLEHLEKEYRTIVYKHPRLVRIDTTSNGTVDTTVIMSHTMEYIQEPFEVIIARENVQMAQDGIAARCAYAEYVRPADSVLLVGDPVLWSGNNQVTGDSIFVFLEENQLRRIEVHGHSMGVSISDSLYPSRFNQLSGKYLTMYFHSNTLEHINVNNKAISLYYLYENHIPNGANKTSGDKIFIEFENGAVSTIHVIGSVEGQYFPEKMLEGREANYNLDGFRWYPERPRRRECIIENYEN
jgi:lipopolysaccharide export system protein LptA